jgi:hypothetical protein
MPVDIDEYKKRAYDMGWTDGLWQGLLFGVPIGIIIGMALMYYGVV